MPTKCLRHDTTAAAQSMLLFVMAALCLHDPSPPRKHVFRFSHFSGVKVEQEVANGKKVLQMSHLILELSH